MIEPARPALSMLAVAFACWIFSLGPPAAATVTVETVSGRRYSGVIDSATNDKRLVLRAEGNRCYARRYLGWQSLVKAWEDDEQLPIAELQARAAAAASDPQSAWAAGDAPANPPDPQPQDRGAPPTPAHIAVHADIANWNRDVLPDGLVLDLEVYDAAGRRITAYGTLTVELVGLRFGLGGGTRRFPVVGRWVARVNAGAFDAGGATLRLPFQALHPEEALDLSSTGMVHAVLAVPGAGTFEAADNLVAVRRFAPLREELFEEQGTRYFPFERTGRGRRLGQ
jgi:hypothetical protein